MVQLYKLMRELDMLNNQQKQNRVG